jgi:hypothetical protein
MGMEQPLIAEDLSETIASTSGDNMQQQSEK